MAIATGNVLTNTPNTDTVQLASGLVNLEKAGQANKASLAATLSRPLPSDLRPQGSGIHVSTNA